MYSWAINPSKLQRAIDYAKAQGKEGDEETIKARYIELAGKINDKNTARGSARVPKTQKPQAGTEDDDSE